MFTTEATRPRWQVAPLTQLLSPGPPRVPWAPGRRCHRLLAQSHAACLPLGVGGA